MNQKKLKIIYILPILIFLFFQINQAEAACVWKIDVDSTKGVFCGDKGDPKLYLGAQDSVCANINPKPPAPTISSCCCDSTYSAGSSSAAPTVDTGMPQWKNPLENLQVKIPGLKFTPLEQVKANCKDVDGKKICNFPWIGEYIAGIYKYAIGIVGILAAVVLMIGGVMWIIAGGSATMIGEAKAWIGASLTGLVIALTSYVLLYQVNPALVGFKGLNITLVDQIPIPENIKEFAEKCKPTGKGACATSNMTKFKSKSIEASAICMAESGGNPNAFNKSTKCGNGDYYAVWGLFQFNLSANYLINEKDEKLNCPDAFGNKAWVNSSPTCTVTNPDLYNQCVTAATKAELSISNAQRLVTASSWGPWETNSKYCHF